MNIFARLSVYYITAGLKEVQLGDKRNIEVSESEGIDNSHHDLLTRFSLPSGVEHLNQYDGGLPPAMLIIRGDFVANSSSMPTLQMNPSPSVHHPGTRTSPTP
jgi:hypothetical protein